MKNFNAKIFKHKFIIAKAQKDTPICARGQIDKKETIVESGVGIFKATMYT